MNTLGGARKISTTHTSPINIRLFSSPFGDSCVVGGGCWGILCKIYEGSLWS